ncbi:MAG TPA: FAD/NAD(P)-binding protein, partial [Candidatus Eisenbacteria bacterium]|nr:FAD/NAD(P)-binding protein [Candidatus Eisenbacteria bacterium]
GGGLSGAAVAHALLARARGPLLVTVIGRAPLGEGTAYSSSHPLHLLNVRSRGMSLVDGDDAHFVRWLAGRDGADADPDGFVPRRVYADYVRDTLAAAEGSSKASLERILGNVVGFDLSAEGVRVTLENGDTQSGDRAVLALGHPPPNRPIAGDLPLYDSPRYVSDPWSAEAIAGLDPDAALLVIGTNLTMFDLAMTLEARGHRGVIHAVSRRGLTSLAHGPAPSMGAPWNGTAPPRSARAALRALRGEARVEPAAWRGIVDSIRAQTPALWSSWPDDERRRFLRHARPYWDIHRHRAAPEIHERIDHMRAEGGLRVSAARLTSLELRGNGVVATIAPRGGSAPVKLAVERVINATGPSVDYRTWDDPLVRALFHRGWIRPGPLGFGLDATAEGAILDRDGRASTNLTTLGPTLRGSLWETTAVPEIRAQAARLAMRILTDLESRPA